MSRRAMINFLALADDLKTYIGDEHAVAVITLLRMAENYSRSMALSTCHFCQGERDYNAPRFEYQHSESCPVTILSHPPPGRLTDEQAAKIAQDIASEMLERGNWDESQAQAFLRRVGDEVQRRQNG